MVANVETANQQVVGTITSLTGTVEAIGIDGQERILQAGDQVHADEVIMTGATASVEIKFNNGNDVNMGSDARVALDSDVYGSTSTGDAATSVEAVQQAIVAGQDPTANLEAPGAGLGGEEGGHDFVRVDLIDQRVNPESGFETEGRSSSIDNPEYELQIIEPRVIEPEPEPPVVPNISISDAQVTEGNLVEGEGTDSTITFNISLDQATTTTVTVNYFVTDFGAHNPEDYNGSLAPLAGTITFNPGDVLQTITIDVTDDLIPELTHRGVETFNVFLDTPVNGNIIDGHGIGTIIDNDPKAFNDAYAVDEGATINIAADGVLKNDIDPDGDVLSSSLVTGPVNGTLTLNSDGSFSYTHNGSETTSDSFIYRLADEDGGSSTATVNITINPQNDGPIAVADDNAIIEDAVPNTVAGNVLTNDTDVDNLPADLSVTTTGNIVGLYGTLTLNANGSYSYALNNANPTVDALNTGDSLSDVFNYTMTDGALTSNSTLTITINGVTDSGIPSLLTVGSNVADVSGEIQPHIFPTDTFGAIVGGNGNDSLIGDTGGAFSSFDSYNVVYAVDLSGSITEDGTMPDVRAALNDLNARFSDYVQESGQNVTIQIYGYASFNIGESIKLPSGAIMETAFNFTITQGTVTPDISGLTTFINQLNSLPVGYYTERDPVTNRPIYLSGTEYAPVLEAIEGYYDPAGPALNLADTNSVYFISDGEPRDNATTLNNAINSFNSTTTTHGINVNAVGFGSATLVKLDQIDNTGGAQLVNLGDGSASLSAALTANIVFDSVGADNISGGDGNDIIFGDVINTDHLDSDVYGAAGTHDGAGYDALVEYLTTLNGVVPTTDAIRTFIEGNPEQFNLAGDMRGEGDTINGGAGNDKIFGQGGNDIIDGGDDNDIIYGGTGDDTMTGGTGTDQFIWLAGDDGTEAIPAIDVITDFTQGIGGDIINLDDLLPPTAVDVASSAAYLDFTLVGGNTEIKIDADAAGGATQIIVLEGVDLVTAPVGNYTNTQIITQLIAGDNLIV